jgi:hypothetical protein
MAALVGFGCDALFYGAFSPITGETSRLLVCLGSYAFLFALSVYLWWVLRLEVQRSVGPNLTPILGSLANYLRCARLPVPGCFRNRLL